MAIELYMPKIGLTMTEGRLVDWLVKVGDRVEKGDVVFIGETEKSTFDFESPASGVLDRIIVAADETVPVGTVVGLLSPLAEEGADASSSAPSRAPAAAAVAASAGPAPAAAREGKLVPLSAMRRTIAERMSASRREAAQTEMVCSVDSTQLLEVKSSLEAEVETSAGARLSLTDLLLQVTAAAVARHPDVNSRWTEEGILYLDAIHLGLAVALDEGLIVPVIRDAGRKSLVQIAAERAALVERGRAGQLAPDEMKGSTVTVSSLGMLGVEAFTAILNPPESAILAIGAINDRPVAVAKQVVVRPMMTVTLSYDHRVLDGASAARFLTTFRELAERPLAAVS